MIKVTVSYPNRPGSRFDHHYYETVHMPLTIALMGGAMRSVVVERGLAPGAPWPAPAYSAIASFLCESQEAYEQAFLPHMQRLQLDMANYTDIEAIVQISEVVIDHKGVAGVEAGAEPTRSPRPAPRSDARPGGDQSDRTDMPRITLISHALCPYVQRAAIVLAEKSVPFERVEIDLANKPAWFLEISPLGKTPVLLVGDRAIFESAVICEYLDETTTPRLHPTDALRRARHRSWMEVGSAILNTIAGLYSAADDAALEAKCEELKSRFQQVEVELGKGPFFAGEQFSIVDAVFGPIFRYFDAFEQIDDFGFFLTTPKVRAWRKALGARGSVQGAVKPEYPDLLMRFLAARKSALSARILEPARNSR